jgi:hypothetical protein
MKTDINPERQPQGDPLNAMARSVARMVGVPTEIRNAPPLPPSAARRVAYGALARGDSR